MSYEVKVLYTKSTEYEVELKIRVPDSIGSYSKEFHEFIDELASDMAEENCDWDDMRNVDARWSVVK
jgi:hypothetical protein